MTRLARMARLAALAPLALGVVPAAAADAAARLPEDYPLPLFEWAVTTELASRVAYACDGYALDRGRVATLLEGAISGAFGTEAAYRDWQGRSMSNADHLAVFELVRAAVDGRAAREGYDLAERAALCAYGARQVAERRPAGWLIGGGS